MLHSAMLLEKKDAVKKFVAIWATEISILSWCLISAEFLLPMLLKSNVEVLTCQISPKDQTGPYNLVRKNILLLILNKK